MTSPLVLLCLAVLLVLCSNYCAAGSVNCRKFVYHPKCRGVAAKRAELPALFVHRPADRNADRKQAFHPSCRGVQVKRVLGQHPLARHTNARRADDEEPELVGLEEAMAGGRPRLSAPATALWTLLADRPAAGLLLARAPKHPADPDSIDLSFNYDYE